MNINDWEIYFFSLFNDIYTSLVKEVEALRRKDPNGYKSHPTTKLLASVHNSIKVDVPTNPNDKKFNLGNTLSGRYKHWKRVKNGIPSRNRIFFRFRSKDKDIVYAWLNHNCCLRKQGDRSDVYVVFRKMLDRGDVPDNYCELLEDSMDP